MRYSNSTPDTMPHFILDKIVERDLLFNPLNVHYVSVGICQRDKDSRTGVKGGKDTDRYGDLDFEPPGFVKIFMFFMSRADI